MNPTLGLRAVRLALQQPEVFLDAAARDGPRERARRRAHHDPDGRERARDARGARAPRAGDRARCARAASRARSDIPLGMMIEVPAAAVMADVFAREAEFFSLGTNDLIQYALAIDRTSQSLADARLAVRSVDPPAHRAAWPRAAKDADIPVSLCGAMASDPLAVAAARGPRPARLSMEAAAIPEIKEALRRVTVAEAKSVADAPWAPIRHRASRRSSSDEFAPRSSDLLSAALGS